MRFFRVRNEQDCRACGSTMMPREEAVMIILDIGGRNIPYTFHIGCYPYWNNEMFNYRLEQWRASNPPSRRKPKSKMGRPRKYVNPISAGRVRASLYYHRRAGNHCKAQELQSRLSELRA